MSSPIFPLPTSLFRKAKGKFQFFPLSISLSLLSSIFYTLWSHHFFSLPTSSPTSSTSLLESETQYRGREHSENGYSKEFLFWQVMNELQAIKESTVQIPFLIPLRLPPQFEFSFLGTTSHTSYSRNAVSIFPKYSPSMITGRSAQAVAASATASAATAAASFAAPTSTTSSTLAASQFLPPLTPTSPGAPAVSGSALTLPSAPTLAPPVPISIFASAVISCLASCSAESISYPFDFAKTRLQIQSDVVKDGKKIHATSIVSRFHGMWDVLTRAPRESPNGIFALYSGLRPALLRQATYGTLKVVIYERLKHILEHNFEVSSAVIRQLVAGALAGALSSAICTPTDLIKVRMAGGDRAQYTSIYTAFRTIIKEEGWGALYKGVGPTTQRAVLVTLLNLPTYDSAKEYLLSYDYKDEVMTHFLASLFAGLFSTYGTNPIDTVKSRIMNQPVDETGRGLLYRNSFHCAVKTAREEGLTALWKGSVPNCCRNVPWLIIFWCSYEALKNAVLKLEKVN